MALRSEFRPNLDIFGVPRNDPGWLYVVMSGKLLKVGKTKNPSHRMRDARTWVPNLKIIGVKPFWNVTYLERLLLGGLAQDWHAGEWHYFREKYDRDFLIEGFSEFYDEDRDMNSVDFIYWFNSSGFSEITNEWSSRRISLRAWQREA